MYDKQLWVGQLAATVLKVFENSVDEATAKVIARNFVEWWLVLHCDTLPSVEHQRTLVGGFRARLEQALASRPSLEVFWRTAIQTYSDLDFPERSALEQAPDVRTFVAEEDLGFLLNCPEYCWNELRIIHEDDNYVAVNKPWDYRLDLKEGEDKRYPSEPSIKDWYKARATERGEDTTMRFAHQLDYATSGVLLLAKTQRACAVAAREFANRRTQKRYQAVVSGILNLEHLLKNHERLREKGITVTSSSANEIMIELYVHNLDGYRMEVSLNPDDPKRKQCRTLLSIIAHGTAEVKARNTRRIPATHVSLKPITGRRHQLRVTLAAIGHAILGDVQYGKSIEDRLMYRLCLHSCKLQLNLPDSWGHTLNLITQTDFDQFFSPESVAVSVCV